MAFQAIPPIPEMINITCNWQVSNSKDLKNCLVCMKNTIASDEVTEFESLVTLDSCISLSRGDLDPTELPEIALKLTVPGVAITDLYIISEARTLELYVGQSKQYAGTTKASFSDAGDDEMSVYNAKVVLRPPSSECYIRFAGFGKGDMWLLGIGVLTKPISIQQQGIEAVQHMLSGVTLSPGAEQCRRSVTAQNPQFSDPSSMFTVRDLESRLHQHISEVETRLTRHIDLRFDELQRTLFTRCNLQDS